MCDEREFEENQSKNARPLAVALYGFQVERCREITKRARVTKRLDFEQMTWRLRSVLQTRFPPRFTIHFSTACNVCKSVAGGTAEQDYNVPAPPSRLPHQFPFPSRCSHTKVKLHLVVTSC